MVKNKEENSSMIDPSMEEFARVDCIQFLNARSKFAKKYCTKKKWDIDNLSLEQLLEIRLQDEWKDPFCQREPADSL